MACEAPMYPAPQDMQQYPPVAAVHQQQVGYYPQSNIPVASATTTYYPPRGQFQQQPLQPMVISQGAPVIRAGFKGGGGQGARAPGPPPTEGPPPNPS